MRRLITILAALIVLALMTVPIWGDAPRSPLAVAAYIQAGKFTGNDTAANDYFGYAVAIEGETAVIGAYNDDDGGYDSGSAYVFDLSDSAQLIQVSKLYASDADSSDYFGQAIAISGDIAVIGASYAGNAGAAYVFDLSSCGTTCTETSKLTASNASTYDGFGRSVAISGNIAVIGTPYDDDGGYDSGSAYVFDLSDPANPVQASKLTAADAAKTDYFGLSVAISGNTAVIGAYYDDDGGYDSGSAYVFDLSDPTNPVQTSKVNAADAAASDLFGYSVAVSGNTAVIGAYYDDDGGDNSGSAYVFDLSDPTNPVQTSKVNAADAAAGDQFGYSVAISGNTAVIGAYRDDDSGDNSGSAYVFDLTTPANPVQASKVNASDATSDDYFGHSVAISGNTAVIGAYYDDDAGTNSGSAYVFVPEKLTIELSAEAASSTEGDSGTSAANLSLLVSETDTTTTGSNTVTLTLADIITDAADTSQTNATITIPAGDYTTMQTIPVPVEAFGIVGDTLIEDDETLTVTLTTTDDNVLIGDANGDSVTWDTATYTVLNDDVLTPDVNMDGVVSPADVVYILNRIGDTVTAANRRADQDSDNDIDGDDAQIVTDTLGTTLP